ncbi:MAG TPA: glycine cleavage system protein GcvH [Steroidobacteraceae bacterium]|nr:glycine cleavage system protein GcvH [Steroidobacteraceae bacterium]
MSEKIPVDLRYTRSHEWVRQLPNGQAEVGITDHAQEALGDLVFVEVPPLDRRLSAGETCAVVESVKAASDVYSPVTGRVIARNEELVQKPELANSEPYGAGWLFRVELDGGALGGPFLTASEYEQFLQEAA